MLFQVLQCWREDRPATSPSKKLSHREGGDLLRTAQWLITRGKETTPMLKTKQMFPPEILIFHGWGCWVQRSRPRTTSNHLGWTQPVGNRSEIQVSREKLTGMWLASSVDSLGRGKAMGAPGNEHTEYPETGFTKAARHLEQVHGGGKKRAQQASPFVRGRHEEDCRC